MVNLNKETIIRLIIGIVIVAAVIGGVLYMYFKPKETFLSYGNFDVNTKTVNSPMINNYNSMVTFNAERVTDKDIQNSYSGDYLQEMDILRIKSGDNTIVGISERPHFTYNPETFHEF